MIKKKNEIFNKKIDNCAIKIQSLCKGFIFRKNNKYVNEVNKMKRIACLKIQKRLRGVYHNTN